MCLIKSADWREETLVGSIITISEPWKGIEILREKMFKSSQVYAWNAILKSVINKVILLAETRKNNLTD